MKKIASVVIFSIGMMMMEGVPFTEARWSRQAPSAPDPANGYVNYYNVRGHIFYSKDGQVWLLRALQIGAVGCIGVGLILWRKSEESPP